MVFTRFLSFSYNVPSRFAKDKPRIHLHCCCGASSSLTVIFWALCFHFRSLSSCSVLVLLEINVILLIIILSFYDVPLDSKRYLLCLMCEPIWSHIIKCYILRWWKNYENWNDIMIFSENNYLFFLSFAGFLIGFLTKLLTFFFFFFLLKFWFLSDSKSER